MVDGEDWRQAAACRGQDPALFYPVDGDRNVLDADPAGVVDRFCRVCPVRAECLADAKDEPLGIWGGRVPDER